MIDAERRAVPGCRSGCSANARRVSRMLLSRGEVSSPAVPAGGLFRRGKDAGNEDGRRVGAERPKVNRKMLLWQEMAMSGPIPMSSNWRAEESLVRG